MERRLLVVSVVVGDLHHIIVSLIRSGPFPPLFLCCSSLYFTSLSQSVYRWPTKVKFRARHQVHSFSSSFLEGFFDELAPIGADLPGFLAPVGANFFREEVDV
jgi:hypothetical protein